MSDDALADLLGETKTPAPITLGGETTNKYKTLKRVLVACCPKGAKGNRSITELAKHSEVSAQGLYAISKKNRITYQRAKELVALSQGNVNIMDFEPYLI